MAGQTRPVWDFEDIGDWWKRADADAIKPIIAVPTTAGTGSEVGRASVITNAETHVKKIIFHPQVLPQIVIADPELTVGMPKFITAGTGLDAFAHCVEAFSSPHYHPMSQGIALEGMRLVITYLPRAYTTPDDLEARAHMMSAAAMGATAFQKGLGAIHAMSHPVGAVFNTHHGTTNAVCMPAVLDLNADAIRTRFDTAAGYLGITGGFDGFRAFVQDFNDSFDIPRGLTDLGVDSARIDDLIEMALEDPSCGGKPCHTGCNKYAPAVPDSAYLGISCRRRLLEQLFPAMAATSCSPSATSRAGSSSRQRATTWGQRVWNLHLTVGLSVTEFRPQVSGPCRDHRG